MPNLDEKGFNPRNWLFYLLQTIAGVFLMGLYHSNMQHVKEQSEINAGVTKILYGLQNQIDKRDVAEGYKEKEMQQLKENYIELKKRVDDLERKKN